MTVPKSRRKGVVRGAYITPEGKQISEVYCRACQQNRAPRLFYAANDKYLDKNGLMSVCKDCMAKIYESHYDLHGSMRKAIFSCCKIFNVAYNEIAIEATEKEFLDKELKNLKIGSVFGKYKSRLTSYMRGFSKDGDILDLTFNAPSIEVAERVAEDLPVDLEYLEKFWGTLLTTLCGI